MISIVLTGFSNPITMGADAQASGDLAEGGAVIAALSEQREHGIGGDGRSGPGGCEIGMLRSRRTPTWSRIGSAASSSSRHEIASDGGRSE
jgi:hypothetical protein